jgi:hypothetical protein
LISSETSLRGEVSSLATSVFLWGAQAEVSDFGATDYIPTTTTAVSVGPVSNLPRLDYPINEDGSVGCPSLLLEPQRSNLFTHSEQFDNATWTKSGATITANAAVSPDGYTNADLQTGGEIYQQKTQPNATACTMSVFVKKDTAESVRIRYIDNVTGFLGGGITYTYATNAITIQQSANASVSGEAINYGNGWYRLILKYTSTAVVTFNYQGIQASGSFIYGAQFETSASYPTSYIPTLAASVTRVADACSKMGISSLIGQTEGTLFADVSVTNAINGTTRRFIAVGDGTTSNRIGIGLNTLNRVEAFVVAANTVQALITSATVSNQRYKIAIAYKLNDVVLYVNGVQIGTDTSATIPAVANLYLSHEFGLDFPAANPINQALLFKTRLTNQQLQELTSL